MEIIRVRAPSLVRFFQRCRYPSAPRSRQPDNRMTYEQVSQLLLLQLEASSRQPELWETNRQVSRIPPVNFPAAIDTESSEDLWLCLTDKSYDAWGARIITQSPWTYHQVSWKLLLKAIRQTTPINNLEPAASVRRVMTSTPEPWPSARMANPTANWIPRLTMRTLGKGGKMPSRCSIGSNGLLLRPKECYLLGISFPRLVLMF